MFALVACLWWTTSAQVFQIGGIECLSARSGWSFLAWLFGVFSFRVVYGMAFVCFLISEAAALVYQRCWWFCGELGVRECVVGIVGGSNAATVVAL